MYKRQEPLLIGLAPRKVIQGSSSVPVQTIGMIQHDGLKRHGDGGRSVFPLAVEMCIRDRDVGYRITPAALEKQAMGLYLYLRRAQIETPPDADDVEDVTFVIEPGESVGSITARLMEKDLITDGDLFRRVLQYHGADSAIEAGRFTLRRSMRMEEVMDELQHGRLLASMVTIPEGWRACLLYTSRCV